MWRRVGEEGQGEKKRSKDRLGKRKSKKREKTRTRKRNKEKKKEKKGGLKEKCRCEEIVKRRHVKWGQWAFDKSNDL